MVADIHPSPHLFLVMGLTLLMAWGPLVAVLSIGIVLGLRLSKRRRAAESVQQRPEQQ
jgi:hypothetical protein